MYRRIAEIAILVGEVVLIVLKSEKKLSSLISKNKNKE